MMGCIMWVSDYKYFVSEPSGSIDKRLHLWNVKTLVEATSKNYMYM